MLGPSERAPRRLARDRAVKLSDVHIKAVEGQSNKAGSGQPLDERGREPQNGNHLYLFCDCLATLTLHTHSRLRIRRLLPFLKSPASRFGPPTTKLSCGVIPYPTHPTSSTPQLREARASDPDSFIARARGTLTTFSSETQFIAAGYFGGADTRVLCPSSLSAQYSSVPNCLTVGNYGTSAAAVTHVGIHELSVSGLTWL